MMKLLAILLLSLVASAQTATHSVALTWQDGQNPTGTTYNVYRGTGTCASNPTFSSIITVLPAMTYTDSAVTLGSYCYYVTATVNGVESLPSPTSDAAVKPFPPSKPATTVK